MSEDNSSCGSPTHLSNVAATRQGPGSHCTGRDDLSSTRLLIEQFVQIDVGASFVFSLVSFPLFHSHPLGPDGFLVNLSRSCFFGK